MQTRTEEDFLGKVQVPSDAYYGAFTIRAANTFKLSNQKVDLRIIRAYIIIKKAAALANSELGVLDKRISGAIVRACDEALNGKFNDQFILDAFQAGAGTPMHMNVNEVLANRANEILGGKKGEYKFVHPNNHVNLAQSSNDVTPTAIRLAALQEIQKLRHELLLLQKSFEKKSKEYAKTIKVGRTHLQDAVPISYGQVFDGYAQSISQDMRQIAHAQDALSLLGIGGTAVGTSINTHPKFKDKIIAHLSKLTGLKLKKAANSIQTTHDMNEFLFFSATLRNYAVTLNRIANDLRLLASGPNAGIAEIILPEVEPGSSIMPGKVNPSVPEAVNMVSYQVMGNDFAILMACQSGQLELNFATPLIAYNLMQSMDFLRNGTKLFNEKCIAGLRVDEKRCKALLDSSFAYATALTPHLGYSVVSRLVREAQQKNQSLKTLVLEKKLMDKKELEKLLSPEKLIRPNR